MPFIPARCHIKFWMVIDEKTYYAMNIGKDEYKEIDLKSMLSQNFKNIFISLNKIEKKV